MNKITTKFVLPATLLVILSGTLYGSLGYFGTQLLNDNFTVSSMLFWRFAVAMVWMMLWDGWQSKNFNLRLTHNWSWSLILSGLLYAGSSVFYFLITKDTGTGLAMVIFFAYPIFVAVATWAKNWRISPIAFLSLLVVVFGLFLLQKNNVSPIKLTSILLGLLASLCYALYIGHSKTMLKQFQPGQFTILICFISAAIFFLIAAWNHQLAAPASLRSWLNVIALGIIATAIPIQLLLDGLRSISPLRVSILSTLEPVVTLIVGILALDESISGTQLVGILIIIVGTIIIQFSRE